LLRELNLKSFAQVELNYCHHRDGLRPSSTRRGRARRGRLPNANESLRTATMPQFGGRKVQGKLTERAWAKA
jgi:hypothetical protein